MKRNFKTLLSLIIVLAVTLVLTGCNRFKYPTEIPTISNPKDVYMNVSGEIGEVVKADKEGIFVKTGKGCYKIEMLKPSGKNAISSRDYLNGNKDLLGKKFYVREVL